MRRLNVLECIMGEQKSDITVIKEASTIGGLLKVVIPVALGMFLVGFDANLFFFGGTFIVSAIHLSPNSIYIGIAGSGFAAGIAIFSVIGGYIFDKITTRNGILISLAIISLFSTLTGFVTNKYELVAYRFLVGFGTGMIQPEIIAFLGDIRPRARQTVIASEGIAFGLGLFVSPYIYSRFSTASAFDIPFIIAGVAGVALIATVVALVPSKYKLYKKPKGNILEILNSSLILISISFLFFGIAFFAFESYFTPYLINFGFTKTEATFIYSFFGLAYLILVLPGGIFGDRVMRKLVLIISGALLVVSSLILFLKTPIVLTAAIGTILFGAGYGIYSNTAAFAQETVEDQWRGSAVGFMFLIFNVGTIIGSSLMGAMIKMVGYYLAGIYVLIIPLVLCLVFIVATPKPSHNLSEISSTTEEA